MRTYRIVEDRSCGIVHTRFTGSLEDCKKWLKNNCSYDEDTNDYYSNVVFCDRSSIYIDDTCNDPENVNGNQATNFQNLKQFKTMKTKIQMLESQLIDLKLEKAEKMNEILEKYDKDIKEIYDRIELLKKTVLIKY